MGATPTSRFEAFSRDVGVAPTRHFHSNQLMLNSYDIYTNCEPYGSKRSKTILQDLRGTLKRKQLSSLAREDIADFISEHNG